MPQRWKKKHKNKADVNEGDNPELESGIQEGDRNMEEDSDEMKMELTKPITQ